MKNYVVESQNQSFYDLGMALNLQSVGAGRIATYDHIHELIEFLYVKEGSFRAYVNDIEYNIGKGDMLLVRSNAAHRVYATGENTSSYYVLKFKLSFIFDVAREQNAADYVLRFVLDKGGAKTHWIADAPENRGVFEAFDRLVEIEESDSMCKDVALKLGAAQVVLETLRGIISEETPWELPIGTKSNLTAHIYKTIKHINRHYSEDLDAEKCARSANMSYSYFSRSFKAITGKSFKEYLNMVRINHAEQLLLSGDKDITEIAMESGYNSVSYFISMCKKIKGQTPLQIRKNKMLDK